MAFGINTGGIVGKLFTWTVAGVGLTIGYTAVKWAESVLAQYGTGTRYSGYQGNVLPPQSGDEYYYETNQPMMSGPYDETRFSG